MDRLSIIVPAAAAPLARALMHALGESPSADAGLIARLSSTGLEPATHFGASALIGPVFRGVLDTPGAAGEHDAALRAAAVWRIDPVGGDAAGQFLELAQSAGLALIEGGDS